MYGVSERALLLAGGIFLMVVAAVALATVPSEEQFGARQWTGVGILFVIGLGMVIGGASTPEKKED